MAETTEISWATSTFNPWIGCTKVSPGCDACYAETLDKRHKWGGATHWGAGVPRHRTSASYWKQPLAWNRKQQELYETWNMGGHDIYPPAPWRVFCASLADVFDNEVPEQWRRDLIDLIELTPRLEWLLVTKRIGNVKDMLRKSRTHDWLSAQKNVRIMITIVNQEEADRDIPKLLALPCKNGISYEPALGPIDFTSIEWPNKDGHRVDVLRGGYWNKEGIGALGPSAGLGAPRGGFTNHSDMRTLEWVIVGGESGSKARPFDIQWARSTLWQCTAAGVPCFFKQAGSNPILNGTPLKLKNKSGSDLSELPVDLQIQEFPDA